MLVTIWTMIRWRISICHPNISGSTFIEIKHKNRKNIIIGSIYRHHSEVSDFLEVLRPTLEKLSNSSKTCIFAGDFNVVGSKPKLVASIHDVMYIHDWI